MVDTVDLPVAMEPVRPMISILFGCVLLYCTVRSCVIILSFFLSFFLSFLLFFFSSFLLSFFSSLCYCYCCYYSTGLILRFRSYVCLPISYATAFLLLFLSSLLVPSLYPPSLLDNFSSLVCFLFPKYLASHVEVKQLYYFSTFLNFLHVR